MNLYVHFPFCRRKCAYCALKSRAGVSAERRAAYVIRVAAEVRARPERNWHTVYFGGGTPALCDLGPIFAALRETGLAPDAEFTVELHPLDVTPCLLETLAAGGVNRISLGVQSFDDAMLAQMGRTHSSADAIAAFEMVQRVFPNSGFDLIAGYPHPSASVPLRNGQIRQRGAGTASGAAEKWRGTHQFFGFLLHSEKKSAIMLAWK